MSDFILEAQGNPKNASKKAPSIKDFDDFIQWHKEKDEPIYWAFDHLQYGFDLLCNINYKYDFADKGTRAKIEKSINDNWDKFDVEERSDFYYPNDNMYSYDNSTYGLKGYVLYVR